MNLRKMIFIGQKDTLHLQNSARPASSQTELSGHTLDSAKASASNVLYKWPTNDTANFFKIQNEALSLPNFSAMFSLHAQKSQKFKEWQEVSSFATSYGNNREIHLHNRLNSDWILLLLVAICFFLALTRNYFEKYLIQIFRSIFSRQAADKLFENRNVLIDRFSYILNFIYSLSFGLFIFQVFDYFKVHPLNLPAYLNYCVYFLVLLLFYCLLVVTCSMAGTIFDLKTVFKKYLHNQLLFNKIFGILLTPLVAILSFIDQDYKLYLIFAGGLLFIFIYLLKTFRGIKIILEYPLSIFYLILYFCTLEILPLLVIYKACIMLI
jgi:hypothetical protein